MSVTEPKSVDVCVFGCGPAGSSVSMRLADAGLRVLVLDRPPKTKPWGGETFTGAIQTPLKILGLWDTFRHAGHVPGYEQRVAWGGAPWTKSSVLATEGHLWHVDRARFDQDLRDAVLARAVEIRNYSNLQGLEWDGEFWQIEIDSSAQIRTRYVVDATGRARAIARKLGVRPRIYDRLTGFTAVLPRNSNFDHSMLIESTPEGWWYAAPVPQGHVLAFFTDADLVPREVVRFMRSVAANSSFAQPESEQGWLTVGDACAAHDPLCGWGVCRALSNGILAADAIDWYLRQGDASALDAYRNHCRDQFTSYLNGLTRHYSHEQRWTSAPFWERRTSAPRPSARGELHAES
jgi:flavin-dependent dehydrogenase